jgi:hypothetical protein
MTEVQRADRRARTVTVLSLLVATACGAVALLLAEEYGPSLSHWLRRAPRPHRLWFGVAALLVLCLPLLLFAMWLWSYALRVLRGNRHPPEGTRVVRDTPVARGAVARRYGRFYQALAGLLALSALAIAWLGWKLWRLH